MRYYINFGTGAGNEFVEGTIEEAKKVAEDGASYTQEDIRIQDVDGRDLYILPWYGVNPEEDDIVTAQFGDSGFYGEWNEL